MKASRRMQAVNMPPIHPMMNRIRRMRQSGETVYSMAQAVPWYGPLEEALRMLSQRLDDPSTHLYGPDPGTDSARSAVLMEEALKVQDSAVICPPTPAQILLEACLRQNGFTEERAAQVHMRLERCRDALLHARGLQWRDAGGGFFTMAACPGVSGYDAAKYLMDVHRIGVIPGEAFGEAGREHVRISFGGLSDDLLKPALNALASVRLTTGTPGGNGKGASLR